MRKKILPLLALLLFSGSCVKQQNMETEVIPEPTEKTAQTEKQKEESPPAPKTEPKKTSPKISFPSSEEKPKLLIKEYFAEKEAENFKRLLGAQIYDYIPGMPTQQKYKDLYVERRPEKLRVYIKDSLLFDINRTTISNRNFLYTLSEILNRTRKTVVIAAFTDNSGSNGFNSQLTKERVKKLKKELISQGIPKTQILTFSCGSNNPIAPNSTVEGRSKNRRIEIYIYPENVEIENICKVKE